MGGGEWEEEDNATVDDKEERGSELARGRAGRGKVRTEDDNRR